MTFEIPFHPASQKNPNICYLTVICTDLDLDQSKNVEMFQLKYIICKEVSCTFEIVPQLLL